MRWKIACTVSPHAHAQEHVTQLADGRIGQDLLDIVLAESDGGRIDRGGHTDDGHDRHGDGRHAVEHIAPGDHIDPGRHHGGCMDQGADRRGTLHGIRKPDVEGNLCRFPRGAHKEQEGDGRHGRRIEFIGVGKDLGEIEGPDPMFPQAGEEEKHSQEKTEVAHPVDDKGLLPCIGGRILLKPESDQEIGTEAHALPSHKHQQEVVGQDEVEHHEDEEVEVGEIPGETRIVMHVSDGIDVDEETDPCDDQGHENRKGIDLVADHGLEIA